MLLSKFTLSMFHDQGSSKAICIFLIHGFSIVEYDHETRGGGHSRILENYVWTNIGSTSKLHPTNYKTYVYNEDQDVYQTPWYE